MTLRGLSLAGLIVAGALPAQAQAPADRSLRPVFVEPIRCAGAYELCAWKRAPDMNGYGGFESMRPQRTRPRPSDSLPSGSAR